MRENVMITQDKVINTVCCAYTTYYDRTQFIACVYKSGCSANKYERLQYVSLQRYCDETMRFVILAVFFIIALVAVWAVDAVSNEMISCLLYSLRDSRLERVHFI